MQTSFNSRLRHIVIAAVASAACLVIKPIAGISEETIKICAIDDASGDFALPVILKTDGAKLAVAEINAAGGVLGKKLELIQYDGQSDVRRHQEFAQRCILEDRANVVMAGYTRLHTTNASVLLLANDIYDDQTYEIGEMQGWLDTWGLSRSTSTPSMR